MFHVKLTFVKIINKNFFFVFVFVLGLQSRALHAATSVTEAGHQKYFYFFIKVL
jgi:hypothetical protein